MHRGVQITNVQTFGTQDPYVIASLLERGREAASFATERGPTAIGGGTDPIWDEDSIMCLESTSSAKVLMLEVWNANTAIDDKIGKVEINVSNAAQFSLGKRMVCTLDTSGAIEATIHCMVALTPKAISLGLRVQRGPHWEGKNSDGGLGELGTVLGYVLAPKTVHGVCPAGGKVAPMRAVVKWDGVHKGRLYSIEPETAQLSLVLYDKNILKYNECNHSDLCASRSPATPRKPLR